jgi:hypothetical protein
LLLLQVLGLFLAAGCIGQDEIRDEPSPMPAASATAAGPSTEPSAEPSPSADATPEPAATPTEAPTPTPTAATSAEPTPAGTAGSADLCSGTDDNREFFAGAAEAFDWAVYCAVLPARWFVADGTYRSADGGMLEIVYRGPDGASLELREGAFCDEADGCVPDGADAGRAAFGDRSGELVAATDGRYALVVDRGEDRSWLAVGDGVDVEVFKDFAAALVRVEE